MSYYRQQRSWGKVIFSQASVILSTGGGACVAGGRGMLGRGGVCGRGVCMVGGVRARERGCAWQGGLRDMHAPTRADTTATA